MVKKPLPGFHDFRDVDSEAQPEGFVRYLEAVTGIEAVQAYKRRSYDLLNLKPGHRVLDVGCGVGDDVLAMARMVGESGRAVGVDQSQIMIGEAKKRSAGLNQPVDFYTGDAVKLNFDNDAFDAVRAERIFQHLNEPERALKEMIRVTRPAGTVGVIEPDWSTIVVDSSDRVLTRRVFAASQDDTPMNPWMGRQLYSLFNNNGLESLRVLAINVPILSFALADTVLNIQSYMKRAVEKSAISEKERVDWLRELEERDHSGRFFSSLSGFGLFGTKPS